MRNIFPILRIGKVKKMGDSLRREVLHTFKKLHRTRMNIFKNDEHAMTVTRHKINEEYRKYLHITNPAAIQELNKFAQEVEHELRTTVIQAVETEPGKFELRITPDILVDNVSCKDTNVQTKNNSSDLKTTKGE
ncbi:complex III assembly factor LYRM7 isoform X2 [Calliopsis andreniformis]|uniref:complex III assembly factor LYRM7 isoform X2 n=1 Tax=Calliopsis andreniformis TaxID=337506 RepID=UPI003FCCC1A3